MGRKQTKQVINDVRGMARDLENRYNSLFRQRDPAREQIATIAGGVKDRQFSPRTQGGIDRAVSGTQLPEEYSSGVRGLPTGRSGQFTDMLQRISGNPQFSNLVTGGTRGLLTNPGLSDAFKSAVAGETAGVIEGQFGNLRQNLGAHVARTRNDAGYGATLAELGRQEARTKAEMNRRNLLDFEGEEYRRTLEGLSRNLGLEEAVRGREVEGLGLMREDEDEQLRRLLVRLGLIKDEDVTEFDRNVRATELSAGADRFGRESELAALDALGQLYGIDTNLLSNLIGTKAGLFGAQTSAALQPGFWSRILPAIVGGAAQVGSAAIGAPRT